MSKTQQQPAQVLRSTKQAKEKSPAVKDFTTMSSKELFAHFNEGHEKPTMSRAIRELLKLGWKQSKIAKALNIRDQFVSRVKNDKFYKGD